MTQQDCSKCPSQHRHIVFLHLDLGIGGAEQLIVNLALASLDDPTDPTRQPAATNTRVSILTTHCDASHCFDAVRPNSDGILSKDVFVFGSFLPVTIFGYGTALCSTIRLFYLCFKAAQLCHNANADDGEDNSNNNENGCIMVLDVLPTPIPYLIWKNVACVIYYCHFPDKLLTRDMVNGVVDPATNNNNGTGGGGGEKKKNTAGVIGKWLKACYRKLLDDLEERTMSYADLICVNSKFTKGEVSLAFPSLVRRVLSHDNDNNNEGNKKEKKDDCLQVLYPAIDLSKFIPPNFSKKQSLLLRQHHHQSQQEKDEKCCDATTKDNNPSARSTSASTSHLQETPIVSLNRFERKKNIQVLLYAYAKLIHHHVNNNNNNTTMMKNIPPLVIAGGYDVRNLENVTYLSELKLLAQQLDIHTQTHFRPSVSDEERATLLQSALCVVYTPFREHFGIVPLEAMFAGSAVVALESGGPMETIVNGSTGILVPIPVAAAAADGTGACANESSSDRGSHADDSTTDDPLVTSMAKALQTLLENPKMAIDMGKRGHEHVKEKFGMDVFRKDWNHIVQDMALPKAGIRRRSGEVKARLDKLIYSSLVVVVALVAMIVGFVVTSVQ